MKLITLIIAFALTVSFCDAQLSYSNATTPLQSIDTSQMGATVWIHNGSGTDDSVKCERTIVYLTPGHGTNFCWDVCYADENHWQSDYSVFIGAGDTNYSFHGYLNPHGVYGVDTVCYNFYNIANIGDAVYVCFAYDNT